MISPDLRTRGARWADGAGRFLSAVGPWLVIVAVLLGLLGVFVYKMHQREECEARGGSYVSRGTVGWPVCVDARPLPER